MKKTMKIMAMVLFVLGMTALTSCSKSKEKLIIGQWKLDSFTLTSGGESYDLSVDMLWEMFDVEEDEQEDMVLEFKNDGKVYMNGEGVPYTISGDQLTIEVEEEYEILTISELTEKALTLEATEVDEDTNESMTIALHFKRV